MTEASFPPPRESLNLDRAADQDTGAEASIRLPTQLWRSYRARRPKANQLLRDFRINQRPVPVFEMLIRLGVQFVQSPQDQLRDGQVGLYIASEGSGSMTSLLLGTGPLKRNVHRRYEAAHLLGRLLYDDVRENSYHWFSDVHESHDVGAWQANVFARDLLIPSWLATGRMRPTPGNLIRKFWVPKHLAVATLSAPRKSHR